MRNSRWICWYLWEGLPTILALPISSSKTSESSSDFWVSQWENHWLRYAIGTLSFVVVASVLVGCLCCRRQRRPKGFQDDAGKSQEFKDGSTAGTETTIERVPSSSLELEVPRILTSSREKIQFDEISCNYIDTRSTIKPPSSSLYNGNDDANDSSRDRPSSEWYERENFPREKLKYLREIGRGWFGKVVEGTTLIEDDKCSRLGKNRGVVVRILTEGATAREKSWFLGESTPYLKLRHPNILELLGFCLESDPYLLLFESCPAGDLKHFLTANRENGDALRKENLPTRIALNVADALEHMHRNGFAHTDLSARNCLVGQDLTAKLGDYGVGVEKYPRDYYVVGDRALPIRWSAPESLKCTETTIETRAITPLANIWSYGVLLWEIASWAERPYDDVGDEQIIEMIFSMKNDDPTRLLRRLMVDRVLPFNFREALEATWKFSPVERPSLGELREILCGRRIENFEKRWENLKPNNSSSAEKSASLQDLRGSVDSELWQSNSPCDKNSLRANFRLGPEEPVIASASLRDNYSQPGSGSETEEESWRGRVERGAYTEKVKQKSKSVADLMILVHIDSDSDVETSLGPQNVDKPSKKRLAPSGSDGDLRSAVIADEFDEALRKLRDPAISNGAGTRTTRNIAENFEAPKITEDIEKPKLLTLTNQGKTPILRLSFGDQTRPANDPDNENATRRDENFTKNHEGETIVEKDTKMCGQATRNEEHVLRLVSKGNPDLPFLRYIPERTSTPVSPTQNPSLDSFLVLDDRRATVPSSEASQGNRVDVDLWSDALAHELEKKNPTCVENSTIFDESIDGRMSYFQDSSVTNVRDEDSLEKITKTVPNTPKSLQNLTSASRIAEDDVSGLFSAPATPRKNDATRNPIFYRDNDKMTTGSSSAPETPFREKYNVTPRDDRSSTCEDLEERINFKDSAPDTPQSRGNYSVVNGDEDLSSTAEELESGMMKRSSHEADDEEDRKHLSTPDDERSSDSGFRDKESCEEEESPIPGPQVSSIILRPKNSSENAENPSPLSASAEEEQMRILFELDTILDAEYYGNFRDADKIDDADVSLENVKIRFDDNDAIGEKKRSISESYESTESTELFETVRANSCDGNFLDNYYDKKGDTNEESKFDFLSEENSADLLESIEADSASDFLKIDDNRSNLKRDDFFADSSSESPIKTDKNSSYDSSIELARLNFDSSSSRGKFELTDFSLDTLSHAMKNESSSEISPMKTDRNSSADLSSDFRIETSDSTSSSRKNDRINFTRDEISEIPEETESSSRPRGKTGPGHIRPDVSAQIDAEKSSSPAAASCPTNFPEANPAKNRLDVEDSSSLIDETRIENITRDETTSIDDETKISTSSIAKNHHENFPPEEASSILEKSMNCESSEDKTDVEKFFRDDVTSDCHARELSSCSFGDTDNRNFPRDEHDQEDLSSSICETDPRNSAPKDGDGMKSWSMEPSLKIHDHSESNITADDQQSVANSMIHRWSSRENIDQANDNDEAEDDSSTMSLKSDNSYVSFGLDEEFVTAIRNELRDKLPHAQMPVVEALDPHDEQEAASINAEATIKGWAEEDEIDENSDRSNVDISIRYNIYGTPLSPIMEERESAGTSESLVSKEESGDASITSRVSVLSDDVLVVDTRTNRAIIVEASANGNPETSNSQQDDDRDTTHGDFSDEENLEYPQNHFNRGLENKRLSMGSGGAPLPSPEEETKWQQQFPLPLQMQDDLMSTSFGTDRDWDSQDDEEGEEEAEEGGEEDEEENSSSSGEFVWKRYDQAHSDLENVATRSPPSKPKSREPEVDLDADEEEDNEEDDEEDEEFTPSAWDATLAPHRSALRSPEKNLKSGDQKKSVWFKKQRYHCVYEYPKETPVVEGQGQVASTWEPTLYTDWEEMMDEPRLDVYPIEYDEANRAGDEEFYVSSSNRPFQFQSGEGKYVSQFFPGASATLLQHENQQQQLSSSLSSSSSSPPREAEDVQSSQDEVDRGDSNPSVPQSSQANGNPRGAEIIDSQQQTQLGELRHTRDRLKLNLLSTSGSTRTDDETGNDNRAGTLENFKKIEAITESVNLPGKPHDTREIDENIEKSTSIDGEMKDNLLNSNVDDATSKNAGKSARNDSTTEVNVEKIEEKFASCDVGKITSESMGLSSSNDELRDREIIAQVCERTSPNVDETGQSSNSKILDNLAVNEASKIIDIGKKEKESTIDNRDVNIKLEEMKELKTLPSDEEVKEIESMEADMEMFGDQKEECSSTTVENETREGELLEIPKLQSEESSSSIERRTAGVIVVDASTNNSPKERENMDAIGKTRMAEASLQS